MAYDYRDIGAAPLPWEEVTGNGRGLITATVTPLDAQRLLENNKNRRLNKNTVLRYAAQMRAGEWDWCDGDSPLKMGPGGVLRNGQHRRGSLAAYGCALYICGRDRSELEAFVTAYVAGGDQTSTTKQTILRKLVEKSFKPRPAWYGGTTIMALDAWADGRGLKVLRAQDIEARYRRAVQAFSEQARKTGSAS